MRSFLLLLALLSSCASPVPFSLVLENASDAILYLQSNDAAPRVALEMEVDGEWQPVSTFRWAWCDRECGKPFEACPALAPEMETAWALLPGDTVRIDYDGEAWIRQGSGDLACVRRTTLSGRVRAQVCHGDSATTWQGEPVEPPDGSGPLGVGGDSEGAYPDEPTCSDLEFDLDAGEAEIRFPLGT